MTNIFVPGDLSHKQFCASIYGGKKKGWEGDREERGNRQNASKKSDRDAVKWVVRTLRCLQDTTFVWPNPFKPTQCNCIFAL